MPNYRILYKISLATGLGLIVWLLMVSTLTTILNYVFFSLIHPAYEFMDPESNASEISSSVGYLIIDNLIWFFAIYFAGFTSSVIYKSMKYLSALIIGCIIFATYFLYLPTNNIIAIYPSWYIYSPFVMALSVVFMGATINIQQTK